MAGATVRPRNHQGTKARRRRRESGAGRRRGEAAEEATQASGVPRRFLACQAHSHAIGLDGDLGGDRRRRGRYSFDGRRRGPTGPRSPPKAPPTLGGGSPPWPAEVGGRAFVTYPGHRTWPSDGGGMGRIVRIGPRTPPPGGRKTPAPGRRGTVPYRRGRRGTVPYRA